MSTITKEFTKEQLIARINQVTAINKYRIRKDPDADGLAMDNELFAIALASIEAEPYGYVHKAAYEQAGSCGLSSDHEAYRDSSTHVAVYTAPPAPESLEAGGKLSHFVASQESLGGDFEKVLAENIEDLYVPGSSAQPAPVSLPDESAVELLATDLMKRIDKITGERHSVATLSSLRVSIVEACRAAMLQGAEPVTPVCKLPGDFESFISWLTSGDGIPDWLINGDKLDDEKVSFLLKVYRAGGNSPVIPDCSCRTCRPVTFSDSRFAVCPECGNKRCPHANDHRNACTGSNEPGQEGSEYPAAPQQEV